MIDPVILGVVSCAVISLVVFLAYFFSSREESDFEKAFNGNALKLLNETKKEKNKQKTKENKKKNDKKKEPIETEKKEIEVVEKNKKQASNSVEEPLKIETKEQNVKNELNKLEKTQPQQTAQISPNENKENVPKQEKKKSPKQINIKDLDSKKFVARLSNEGIDQEYIQYLNSYFKENDAQKNNLTNELKAIQKKFNECNQKIEKVVKEKNLLEARFKEEKAKSLTLSTKTQQLQASESESRKQLAVLQSINQRNEIEHANELTFYKNKIVQFENELGILRAANQKLGKDLKAASLQVPEAELKNLKAEFCSFEKVANAVKDQLDKKSKQYEDLKEELEKRDKLVSKLEIEKAEWVNKEKQITNEYHSLKALVNGMNNEISQFVTYKQEQDEIIKDLKRREAEYQEEKKNEAAKLVEIPKNEPVIEEETFVLKKNTTDLAAPPTTSNKEYEKIVEEKNQLQAKVDELRARNIAILEKVEEAEKLSLKASKNEFDVEEERKKVVQEISKFAIQPFEKLGDTKAYTKWLQETINNVQKKLSNSNSTQKSVSNQTEVTSKKEKSEQHEDIGSYRNVLKSLINALGNIENLAAKQAADYESTISELKLKI